MRVLVTGGTGFVGSHTVAALAGAGHDVRLLVRDPARLGPGLGPLGLKAPDHVVGDVIDEQAVERALDGCDAVVHAASVVSLAPRDAHHVMAVNTAAAELVLGHAHRRGLDPIVHVSSVSALLPPPAGETVTGNSPVQDPAGAYGRSKAAAERVARKLQDGGAPVTTVYPTMVLGPHDPNMGEGTTAWRQLLRGLVPGLPVGGMYIVDVRDVAAVHAALLEPGRGARRYLVAGHHVTTREIVDQLGRLTGRRLLVADIPVGLARRAAVLGDRLQRALPLRLPLSEEGVAVLTLDPRCDDSATWKDLGLRPRPLVDTVSDMVAWMVQTGLLPRRRAGKLAPRP